MKKLFLLALTATLVLSSCKKDHEGTGGIFRGPLQKFQHGKAWTWVQTDKYNKPERIAIAIDDEAMNSLDPGGEQNGGHNHANALSLVFHPKANVTLFQHALLDWNPAGHEPAGVYTLPHFDFHFYMTSEAERKTIPPFDVNNSGFLNFPAQGYMPAIYSPVPGGVPQMGTHWIDVTSPEINGGTFTQTFLYGSYNGNVTFYEPMITKAFLDGHPSFQRNFPVPAKFKIAGYYPTKMRVEKINGVTNVILEGFEYRQAS
ncbi:MAG: hypothetical protein ACXWWC_11220 [Chitinophagaceae bacterium]